MDLKCERGRKMRGGICLVAIGMFVIGYLMGSSDSPHSTLRYELVWFFPTGLMMVIFVVVGVRKIIRSGVIKHGREKLDS